MDKKWNKWLIILGIILLIIPFLVSGPEVGLFTLVLIIVGLLLVGYGSINYTDMRTWVKNVLTIVITVVLFYIYSAIYTLPKVYRILPT